MRRTVVILSILAALAASALVAPMAGAALKVGVGDQKASVFSDPAFTALKIKRTRYFVAWDAINKPNEIATFDNWYKAARAARTEPLIAFNLSSNNACPRRPCTLPSTRAYTKAFRKFRKRYPQVRLYQPWNESNSRTQPTYTSKGARRVAQFQNVIVRYCKRCTVGPDVQNLGNAYSWARTFARYVRKRPAFYGLHNYTDVNRFRTRGTDRFVAQVRPSKVWLTETGGVYSQELFDGRITFRPSEARQAKAQAWLLRIARKHSRSIDRIYLYNWSTEGAQRFDSALIGPGGNRRKAYDVFKSKFRRYIR